VNRSHRKFRGLRGLRERGDPGCAARPIESCVSFAETLRVERSSKELFGRQGGFPLTPFYLKYIFYSSLSLFSFLRGEMNPPRNCIHLLRVRIREGGRDIVITPFVITRKILLIGCQKFFPCGNLLACIDRWWPLRNMATISQLFFSILTNETRFHYVYEVRVSG